MTSPSSNAYKNTYRNTLKYTGQNYRFVPTYLRNRDPIAPQNASPDIKPPEQQGYYPVSSLWTNTTTKSVWLLRGITNNLSDWVRIAGGDPVLSVAINTPISGLIDPLAGVLNYNGTGVTISGNSGTGLVNFNATPVLGLLNYNVVNGAFPNVHAQASTLKLRSADGSVVISGTFADTIDLSSPGGLETVSTDLTFAGAPNGTAAPNNRNLKILGNIATVGIRSQGLATKASPSVNPDTVYLQYQDGIVTTANAAVTPIKSILIDDNRGFTITGTFSAFDTISGDSYGGRLTVVGSNILGTVFINSVIENVTGGNPSLAACIFNATQVGNELRFNVQGIVGKTIRWHAMIPWIAVA